MNPGDLNELLQMFETFRGEQATELIRQNYLRRHVEETQSMLVNVDDECLDRNKVWFPPGGGGGFIRHFIRQDLNDDFNILVLLSTIAYKIVEVFWWLILKIYINRHKNLMLNLIHPSPPSSMSHT